MKLVTDLARAPFGVSEARILQDNILDWLARCALNTRAHGAMYVSTAGTVTLTAAADPVKFGETTTAGLLDGFVHVSDGRLIYTRSDTEVFHVAASGTLESDTVTSTSTVYLAKNGTVATGSGVDIYHGTADKAFAFTTAWTFSLGKGDYIDLRGGSDQNSDLTLHHLNLTIQEAS